MGRGRRKQDRSPVENLNFNWVSPCNAKQRKGKKGEELTSELARRFPSIRSPRQRRETSEETIEFDARKEKKKPRQGINEGLRSWRAVVNVPRKKNKQRPKLKRGGPSAARS